MTIFEGKIAQFCALVKSTIFIVGIPNFGITYFKRYFFYIMLKTFSLHRQFKFKIIIQLLGCNTHTYFAQFAALNVISKNLTAH